MTQTPLDTAYERFEATINQGIEDPGPIIAELRSAGPLVRSRGPKFGSWTLPSIFPIPDEMESAMVLSYDAVTECLRNAELFQHRLYPDVGGETFLHLDGPPHRRYRLLLGEIFSLPACEAWRKELIEPVVERLIETVAAQGRADLRRDFCENLPAYVFGAILGVPEEDFDQLKAWAVHLIAAPVDNTSMEIVINNLGPYLYSQVAARRALPADELASRTDLVSCMVRAEHPEFGSLNDLEITSALHILVAAGNETTGRGLSTLLYRLLTEPGALDAVRAERSLIPAAFDEALRLNPAGGCFELRLATADTTLEGQPIAEGTAVVSNLFTANRDPSRWDDPDRFDLHRERKQTVSFGFGPHMCLGLHLARQETFAAMEKLLDRFPALRPDETEPAPRMVGFWFPGVDRLPVVW